MDGLCVRNEGSFRGKAYLLSGAEDMRGGVPCQCVFWSTPLLLELPELSQKWLPIAECKTLVLADDGRAWAFPYDPRNEEKRVRLSLVHIARQERAFSPAEPAHQAYLELIRIYSEKEIIYDTTPQNLSTILEYADVYLRERKFAELPNANLD